MAAGLRPIAGLQRDTAASSIRIIANRMRQAKVRQLFGGVLLVRMESPCVVLWRLEAIDCRVLIPPESFELAYPSPAQSET